jgi:hypothetical protein
MFKSLPVAALQVESPYQIGYIGLYPASPFLQSGLHVLAADDVLEAADDLVEHDVDDALALCIFGVGLGSVCAVSGTVPRHPAIGVNHLVQRALEQGAVRWVAIEHLAGQDQVAFSRADIDLVAKLYLPAALDDNVGVQLVDGEQFLVVGHRQALYLLLVRHLVHQFHHGQQVLHLPDYGTADYARLRFFFIAFDTLLITLVNKINCLANKSTRLSPLFVLFILK